jgi:dienelactone hydrolase
MARGVGHGGLMVCVWLAATGCDITRTNDAARATEGDGCTAQVDCAGGLVCSAAGYCATPGQPGTASTDGACHDDADCQLGLVCSAVGRCGPLREGKVGATCRGGTDCGSGLVCGQDGTCSTPGDPGTAAAGDACTADADCAFALVCGTDATCTALAPWPGVSCEAETGPPRVLFEVPKGGPAGDFFRLPFPNDVRVTSGVVDLSDFPGLDHLPAPGDLLGRYVAALTDQTRGFGLNPPILFRFSTTVDFDTLKFGGDDATFFFVDVTPGGARHGRRPRSRFFATTDRSRYACAHWLGLRPSEGSPLDPDSTYAVVFRKGIRATDGQLLVADGDFAALVSEAEPEHPALQAAWNKYAPLRAWLREQGIAADDVVGGTLFTTGDPLARTRRLRDAVQAAPAPTIEGFTRCGAGVTSPCEGGGVRTCGVENDVFVEYHAHVSLPVFQRGVPPYLETGGDIVEDADGLPRRQRMEPVCVSITVPKSSRPGRLPVVLYAHDIGGNFRSAAVDGVAARLAQLGYAVVGYDGVLHGPRAGMTPPATAAEAGALVFNLANPGVLRDVGAQGAADLMQLARFVRDADLKDGDREIQFQRANVAFMGHGFGAEVGTLFLALEPDVRAGVLAAGGGGMDERLRLTRLPYPVAAGLAEGLADTDLNGLHPGVGLLQAWLDPRDPSNYGELLRLPPEGVAGKHLFLLAGVDDAVTPPPTMDDLAVALHLERVGEELEKMEAVPAVEGGSAHGNFLVRGKPLTRAVKQYAAADGHDPHRVAFEQRQATADIDRFFQTLVADPEGVPTVSP